MNKQQLAATIWESANKMRSKIEANEYKDFILGFIFYKFLSEKELEYVKRKDWKDEDIIKDLVEEDADAVKSCKYDLGYFIAYKNLFSTWLKMGSDFNIANVADALAAFNRNINPAYDNLFTKIFDTLQMGLSKLGDTTASQTKSARQLIQIIDKIPMKRQQDYDVLGYIYEYLISKFASNAGKKAGEFYTPHEVSLVMSEIVAYHLKDRTKIRIYDPTSGSGSLLINIGRCAAKYMQNKDGIYYYAQELKENTYNLTRMNLVMRGILPANIKTRNADTLEDDWPLTDEKDKDRILDPLQIDAVVSNPPYSQNWDPTNKESDPRYAGYGLAPKSKADYAFLLHDLYHVKPDGIMTIVLPHGVLFRGGVEEEIRKQLIERNQIDAIIGLPANIFYGTGIPTIIMVLKQQRENTDILMIDAAKEFIKSGKNNTLQASHIKKIVDTFIARKTIEKYARVVSYEEIIQNAYNLNIPRYVDSAEEQESYDIYATMYGGIPNVEIAKLKEYWQVFPTLKKQLFAAKDENYSTLIVEDVQETIEQNCDVIAFKNNYKNAFADFKGYLKDELLQNMETVHIAQEENEIADNIFVRLQEIPLVDKYKAYQCLDDAWVNIAIDLEMIQTEGFNAIRQVDPNIVIKKVNGIEIEKQDGWVGHVLPFALVQEKLLQTELQEIKSLEDKIAEIKSNYTAILEELEEEDKESNSSLFNEDNTAFVTKELNSYVQSIKKRKEENIEDTFTRAMLNAYNLMENEKKFNKILKQKNEALQVITKIKIESLTDAEALKLLEAKWIDAFLQKLYQLPENSIANFVAKVEKLNKKYTNTLLGIEKEIEETESTLTELLAELEGDAYDMQGIQELIALLKRDKND